MLFLNRAGTSSQLLEEPPPLFRIRHKKSTRLRDEKGQGPDKPSGSLSIRQSAHELKICHKSAKGEGTPPHHSIFTHFCVALPCLQTARPSLDPVPCLCRSAKLGRPFPPRPLPPREPHSDSMTRAVGSSWSGVRAGGSSAPSLRPAHPPPLGPFGPLYLGRGALPGEHD